MFFDVLRGKIDITKKIETKKGNHDEHK